jgi:membrane-associated protein
MGRIQGKLISMHIDVSQLIQSGGLVAIAIIIFAESGMMVGFFFPGDTLLLSAGVLVSTGKLALGTTILVVAIAAILGDNTGYTLGKLMGKRLFRKKDGILFRHEYVERAEIFYEKHGAKTMLIAHFVPIVRSFAPLVAGVGHMPRIKFVTFDAIGDVAWTALMITLGYWFGKRIPNLDHYILPVAVVVMILSFTPTLWHLFGNKASRNRILSALKRSLHKKHADSDPSS